MSNSRYGFIRDVEADLVDRTLGKIKSQFGEVRFLEIGVFCGDTVRGVVRWCQKNDCPVYAAGVDCMAHYKPNPAPLPDYVFYEGDSMDMWREIKEKFNFLWIDGCHCVNHSACDFINYSPLVVVGGACLFHDTALPSSGTKQEEWPQDHSYAGKPPSVLGVREGLKKLGLLQDYRTDWKLIEEVPSDTGLMGAMVFEKVLEL